MLQTTSVSFNPGQLIAIAFVAGFAIQQLLQILDWLITPTVIRDREIIWGMPAGDFKKGLMNTIAFLCGLLIAALLPINLLEYVTNDKGLVWLGILISGFVLGSGTEAANSFIKYFGYLKDAQKYEVKPEIEVLINPVSAAVKVNEIVNFKGIVQNSDSQEIDWQLVQSNGGQLDEGRYTAPATAGVYDVRAVSKADKTKFAIAKVTVK